ncbi:hypothetical protein JCM9279_007529 [Rhodotorula babjevae]
MAALTAYPDAPESWDDDPDLDLSSASFHHPSTLDLTLQPPSDSEPASPAIDHDFDDDAVSDGFFERAVGEWDDPPRTREEDNESSVDSSRTTSTTGTLKGLMQGLSLDREDDNTLSFDIPPPSSSPPPATPELDATPRTSKTTTLRGSSPLSALLAASRSPSARRKVHHLGSTPLGQAQAVDDDWDEDLKGLDALQVGGAASTAAGPHVVVKKGSFSSHISLDDEEDGLSAFDDDEPAVQNVARKRISIASFTDAEDNGDGEDDFELPSALSHVVLAPTLANRSSNVSLSSAADGAPVAPAQTPTTPGLAGSTRPLHPSFTTASSAASTPGPLTPSRSSDDDGPSSSALDDDDDADFFEDLVLPSYFLAGSTVDDAERKRAATPPTSEGEPDSDVAGAAAKVDLQSILRAKLEARGGRGLLFHPAPGAGSAASTGASPSSPHEQERLARHREHDDEADGADLARELRRASLSSSVAAGAAVVEAKEEEWSAREMRERMRVTSGARAKEAQQARDAREASRSSSRIGVLRRTASDGKVPVAQARRGVPPLPTRASTSAPLGPRSSLPHATSAGSRSSIPQPVRPASAHAVERPPSVASSHSTEGGSGGATRRRGPPPAPSAASRGRARLRASSLRTTPSSTDLRAGSKGRPAPLDPPASAVSSSTTAQRSVSPVPVTPATPSSAASRPSLRLKRSQQHLSAAAAVAASSSTSARTLDRKRSLQSMSALASPTPGAPVPPPASSSRSRSRQNSLRSPSPAGPRPSFAAPTAASASRTRERVHSSPAPLVSASPAALSTSSFASTSSSSRPHSTLSGTSSTSDRLLRPTLASASKVRTASRPSSPTKPQQISLSPRLPSTAPSGFLSSLRVPSAATTLSRPLSSLRTTTKASYGDGTELDAFDDLPVSKERERERVVPPASSRKSSGASTATVKSGAGSWGRKEGVRLAQRTSSLAQEKRTAGAVQGRKEGAAMAAAKTVGKAKEREKEKKAGELEKKKPKRRREPHLIRHLGPTSAIKVQGEMTYNPVLQRWEGNEAVLREFDKALTTSTRPALISPFSSAIGSPHRGSFAPARPATATQVAADAPVAVKPVLPHGATPSASRGTAKVVGNMVFDPATCSWHAVDGPDAEDELELDWGGGTSGGEAADDECASASALGASSDVDGWELGERERMLKNRASFVLEEGSDEDGSRVEAADAREGEGARRRAHTTRRQILRESEAAEARSRVELAPWRTVEANEGSERRWLWELRALVLDIA